MVISLEKKDVFALVDSKLTMPRPLGWSMAGSPVMASCMLLGERRLLSGAVRKASILAKLSHRTKIVMPSFKAAFLDRDDSNDHRMIKMMVRRPATRQHNHKIV